MFEFINVDPIQKQRIIYMNSTKMGEILEQVEGQYHMFCKGRGGSLTEITTLEIIYKLHMITP